jgi:hypothetical protein
VRAFANHPFWESVVKFDINGVLVGAAATVLGMVVYSYLQKNGYLGAVSA